MPIDRDRGIVAHRPTRELDRTTADAVALMTLYIGATAAGDVSAAALLDELLAAPGGILATIDGLQSLCGSLLVLLELHAGIQPEEVLQRVGAMAAAAGAPPF